MRKSYNFLQIVPDGEYVQLWSYRRNVKGHKYGRTSGGRVLASDRAAVTAAIELLQAEMKAKFG